MTGPLLAAGLRSLEGQADSLRAGSDLQASLHLWLLRPDDQAEVVQALTARVRDDLTGADRSIDSVAAFAFLVSATPGGVAQHGSALRGGIEWLLGRPGTSPQSLVALSHPVSQLALLAGLIAIDDDGLFARASAWMRPIIQQAAPSMEGWRSELLLQIRGRLDGSLRDAQPMDVTTMGLVFASGGLGRLNQGSTDKVASDLVSRIQLLSHFEAEHAALDLVAYRYLARGALSVNLRAVAIEDVVILLERLSSGLRLWTWEDKPRTPKSTSQRWSVQNEYHVQNLLFAVLKPALDEVREEEWLAAVGQKRPRADLAVPPLSLLIEVKFWREQDTPQKVISEIAEDVGLYLTPDSPYRHLIPVVWDQGRRAEEHDTLRTGLKRLRGVVAAVIVSQPAFMTRHIPLNALPDVGVEDRR